MKVVIKHITPLHVVSEAIRECYDSHDKSDTKCNELGETFIGAKDKALIHKVGNINKHKSVMEHCTVNIRIEGVSRLLLQEFARHRIASLSVKSTRFTLQELKGEEPFIKDVFGKARERAEKYIVFAKRDLFDSDQDYNTFTSGQMLQLDILRDAICGGVKRDVAKYLVPDSYKTNIAGTINFRSLQNFLYLRSAKNAHFEIQELANKVFAEIPAEYKYLLEDYMHITY